jgi:hypothetical protein
MRRSLFAFVTLVLVCVPLNAQQFHPEYFSFDARYPAVQVDLNGDGIPDLIGLNSGFQVIELLSSGEGNFTSQTVSISGSGGGHPIASGDFNGDGKTDVILFQPMGIAYGDGKGGFSSVQSISWSGSNQQFNYAQAQVADFNGDGKPDLAIGFDTIAEAGQAATFQVVLFINNGNGFDDGVPVYTQQVPSGSIEGFEYTTDLDLLLGDFDADGHADLIFRTTESDPNNPGEPVATITALYGDGNGGLTPVSISTSSNLFEVSAADMNNDGTSDVVASDYGAVMIFYGQPNRTFTAANLTALEVVGLNPILADFSGDQRTDKDIVYASFPRKNNTDIGVSTLMQTGAGKFDQKSFESIDTYQGGHGEVPFYQSFVGDYNADGKPDVMLISATEDEHPQSADVLLNTRSRSNGTCQAPAPTGIHVCSPTPNETVANPVKFSFSATSFYPVRKMEIWIDGKKLSETYEVFANEGFADVKLRLKPGSHNVGLYSGGFDGTVQHTSYSITVH